ncbi:MAG: response regulator [Hormoscilla sp. GM102CHS1]|nr:response regulator [Hormoscilla sp. GM102CHS1]
MHGKKILVVEDELIAAKSLAKKLNRAGYEVIDIVSHGEKAIKVALKEQPDLVLMDIRIKGNMDGIEARTEIGKHLQIPVIYVTAYADKETMERAWATKPYGYLTKPFKFPQVLAKIEMALEKP